MRYLVAAARESTSLAASALGAATLGLLLLLIAALASKRRRSRGYVRFLTSGTVFFAAAVAVA